MLGRQRHLVEFTLASLARRKGRNGALIAVYTLTVFLLASVVFLTQALRHEASVVLQGSPEILVQRLEAGRHALIPASYAEAIGGIRGVRSVTGRLWGYYYDPVSRANYTLLVPKQRPPEPGMIDVGSGIARSRGAFEGDTLSFRAYDGSVVNLTIERIIAAESDLVSADLILMADEDFRGLFGLPGGQYTDLAVAVPNRKEQGTVASKILLLLPDSRPILRDEILRTYDAVFDWRGGILIVILLAPVVAFVILALDKAAGLSAGERHEIGILKAIGWDTGDVLVMKFWEGAAVSLTSFLLGTLAAYVHVFHTSASLFTGVLKGWSVLYPEFTLTPVVDAYQVAALFVLTVVPYTVATIIPSWRAATVDPDAVMRG